MRVLASTLFASLFSLTAFAHVEPGLYRGTTDEGKPCMLRAGETTYLNDLPHPLNERIAFEVKKLRFSAGHPPAVDEETTAITFNHDVAQEVVATKVGARALVVKLEHSKAYEGPIAYMLIEDNWKAKARKVFRCLDLKFAK